MLRILQNIFTEQLIALEKFNLEQRSVSEVFLIRGHPFMRVFCQEQIVISSRLRYRKHHKKIKHFFKIFGKYVNIVAIKVVLGE